MSFVRLVPNPVADSRSERANSRVGVHVLVGLIADARGRLLVNQRRPGTHMAGWWEFPGGKLAAGETPREGLDRELAEELGIRVLDAEPFLQLVHDYPEKRVLLDVWRIERYAGVPHAVEQQVLEWVEAERLAEIGLLAADRPIVDALLRLRQQQLSSSGVLR